MKFLGYDVSICFLGIGFSKTEYLYGWLIQRTTYGFGASPKIPLISGVNKVDKREYSSTQELIRKPWSNNLWVQLFTLPISMLFYREISKFNWIHTSGEIHLSNEEEEYLVLFPWNRSKLIANKRIGDQKNIL